MEIVILEGSYKLYKTSRVDRGELNHFFFIGKKIAKPIILLSFIINIESLDL